MYRYNLSSKDFYYFKSTRSIIYWYNLSSKDFYYFKNQLDLSGEKSVQDLKVHILAQIDQY